MKNKDEVVICYQKNNSFDTFFGAYSPKDIGLAISSPEEITGFKFIRQTSVEINEDTLKAAKDMGFDDEIAKLTAENGKFMSTHYFIGKILAFDEIKNLFNNPYEIEDKYKEVKYVVLYDKDGAAYDVRPLLSKKKSKSQLRIKKNCSRHIERKPEVISLLNKIIVRFLFL